MSKKTKILLLVLFLIFAVSLSFYFFQEKDIALAGTGHNLSGFAWSNNIGWISFNCTNREAGTGKICFDANSPLFNSASNLVDYGVNVNPGGAMSGYAWSDNIGWISFQDLSGCPDGNCYAKFDKTIGQVSGWAKAVAGGNAGSGGWDGWIKLSGDMIDSGGNDVGDYNISAGPEISGVCDWSGLAWGGDLDDDGVINYEGDEVIGWISLKDIAKNGDPYGVKGIGDACAVTSSLPDLVIKPINNIPNITQGNSAIFVGEVKEKNNVSVTDSFKVRFCVDSTNEAGCFNGTSGFIINEQDIASLSANTALSVASNSWDSSSYATSPPPHKLFICADVENTVSESNDTINDNCKKKNFNVVSAAPVCIDGQTTTQPCTTAQSCSGTQVRTCSSNVWGAWGPCNDDPSDNCPVVPPSTRPWWWWIWQEK